MTEASKGAFPSLIVLGGPFKDYVLKLDGESGERLLGSGPQCDLELPMANVEATHARLVWAPSGVTLYDAGTENGTFVNGERIEVGWALSNGHRVSLGPPGEKDSANLLVRLPYAPRGPVQPSRSGQLPTEEPSMVGDLPAEDRRPTPRPAAPKFQLADVPRPVLIGVGTAVLTIAAFTVYHAFQQPPPVLLSIIPPRVEPGQTVSLSGSLFDSNPGADTVRFGDLLGEVTSASDKQLTVVVPPALAGKGPGDYKVSVAARGGRSNALFLKVYLAPRIASLEPDVAMPGDEVLGKGQNLAGSGVKVVVGDQPAEVTESQASSLRFRVPDQPVVHGKIVAVQVQVGPDWARPASLILGRPPLVLEVSPSRGLPGEKVTLRGRGFDPTPSGNAVTFAGQPALVLQASATEMTVMAPAPVTGGQVAMLVTVRAQGRESATQTAFTVQRPSASVFTPRYFAAPVPEHASHDHVLVSTELGPLLLLTGKADAPSTAERAARVADALNRLVASGRAVVFEAREKPDGVAAAGSPILLLAATPEDAAAYDEGWEPGARSAHATPHGVASYWAALLSDHLAMFVQHQRPFRAFELSPGGKALLDLYVEGARRGSGNAGVPMAVVSSISPALARDMRRMALVIPGEGESTGGAPVAGRWDGTVEETGKGTRPVQLHVRMAGARLAGSLTTRSGQVAMDIPIKDVTYEKGVLSFTVVGGGTTRRFSGKLQGETLSGTIAGDAKESAGRFSLRWVE